MTTAASTMPPSVTSLPTGSQVTNKTGGATSTLNQNDFLTLLTTQLEKQDPLNPTNPSDLAAELAQFSTATGVQNLQQTMQSAAGVQATGLIGHNVAVTGNVLTLGQSGTATGLFNLAATAKDAAVTITDSRGNVVSTIDLGAMASGDQSFSWDGKALDGSTAPAGNYTFTVGATSATGSSVASTAYAVVPVTAVSVDSTSGATLDLGGGIAPVALSAVHRIF